MRSRWTPSQTERLWELAGKIPTAQIAHEIGKANSAIIMKAYSLQLSLRVKRGEGRSHEPGAAEKNINRAKAAD